MTKYSWPFMSTDERLFDKGDGLPTMAEQHESELMLALTCTCGKQMTLREAREVGACESCQDRMWEYQK